MEILFDNFILQDYIAMTQHPCALKFISSRILFDFFIIFNLKTSSHCCYSWKKGVKSICLEPKQRIIHKQFINVDI